MTRLKSAAAHWLRKFGVEPEDFLPPRSGELGRHRSDCESPEKVLASRKREFGVFSRPFYGRGEPRAYRDVQLPEGFDILAAVRKANAIGPTILGVTPRNKGLGLRTKECDFEKVVGQIYTSEEARRFMGDRWEVTNLPLSWSKAAVQAFLSGWPCTVEATYRAGKTRNAIARLSVPPLHHRLQQDYWCAIIRPAEARKRPSAQHVLVWAKPGKATTQSQNAAKSRANVVRGKPMKDTPSRSATRSASSQCGKPSSEKCADGHFLCWCFPNPGSGQQTSCYTAFHRVRSSTNADVKGRCRLHHNFRTAHRFLRRSLSHQDHVQHSWQTLPHSSRCSCHQCKRSSTTTSTNKVVSHQISQ